MISGWWRPSATKWKNPAGSSACFAARMRRRRGKRWRQFSIERPWPVLPNTGNLCMIFLPIVERVLRAASRRRGTYWNRAVAALAAILIFGGALFFEAHQPPKELGKDIFNALAGLFLFSSLVAGVRYTADCLSEEKREGTLGLLFLTDLKGYDVVLGKLAATSLNAFYGVLAVLPMMAIPLLMGGVTLGQFGPTALVAVNALFFSLAVRIFVSAISKSARIAAGTTFFLVFLFTALLPAAGA